MRKNEYKDLDEFIADFTELGRGRFGGCIMGIEFTYNKHDFRLCNEPKCTLDPEDYDKPYWFYSMDVVDSEIDWQILGKYASLEDVLDNCYIFGRKFREAIMDDDTIINSKD